MTTRACERLWEVDALREGRLSDADAESFERHRRACADCRTQFADDERLRDLARRLEQPVVDELRAKRLRARILRDAAGAAEVRPTRVWWATAASVAAAALLAIAVWTVTRTPSRVTPIAAPVASSALPSATITAREGAVFVQERLGALETVRLTEGTITVSVPHREAGERFVAILPDGEIEVRGTIFTVVVERAHTVRVRVDEGVVALRIDAAAEVTLHANEEWVRSVATVATTATSAQPAATVAAASTGHAQSPAGSAAPSADVSEPNAYADAMSLYRAQRWDDAARAFHAFASSHPRAPESEDASFLEAASLARAGRADAAAVVAERFLEHHPSSFHARDAAMLVARVARDRGDCEKARRVASPWTKTGMPQDWKTALGACAM